MDRRSFLKTGVAATTLGAAAAAGGGAEGAGGYAVGGAGRSTENDNGGRAVYGDQIPVAQGRAGLPLAVPGKPPQRVYVLGGHPAGDKALTTIRMMCDNVFDRLIREVETEGCQYFVCEGDRVGYMSLVDGVRRMLKENWHTHYGLDMSKAVTGQFPLDDFIEKTSRWTPGMRLNDGLSNSFSAKEAFALGSTRGVVGMHPLPKGTMFAAHYIDTVTGMVMRAVAIYGIADDHSLMRFDVLVG